ncbi:MAG: aminopeptidase N, partial [Duodenibacillus sp.]|nr:aminopeptidase N [Duodenibacillus sp.]
RKPCYLFALVAGDLVSRDETIVKGDGSESTLQIWTEPQNYDKGAFALESLKKAIAWDRGRFGLDLDLSHFSIVATDDFNFGAMENKGLNIFNTRCVMASPASATDQDYALVESVIAHEYCHNWTGDRVTLRDWFQLTLKEGLTVFRDQEFTMDTAPDDSARAVKRIEDARYMRRVQYLEDAGPMAHPIRPDSYREINNFYTATVYDKGAEVIRMLQTIIGREAFGKALSHYIAKFDGRAVTCDDFLGAIEESCGRDLKQFSRWWSQAGTPRVSVRTSYNQINWTYTITASQTTAPTPGQPDKEPLLIPIAVALIDQSSMQNLPLGMAGSDDKPLERVLELSRGTQSWVFTGIPKPPALSLGRGYSAPVIFEYERSDEELGFLARHDTDPFNRAEAMQELSLRMLSRLCDAIETGQPPEVSAAWQTAFAAMLADEAVAPGLKALALKLPSEAEVGQRRAMIDPASIRAAVQKARETIGRKLAHELAACAAANVTEGPYSPDAASAGKRALKNLALDYWLASNEVKAVLAVRRQFDTADNLTDQLAALSMCANGRSPAKTKLLSDAISKWYPDPLLVNKWFRVQATAVCHPSEKPVVDRIRELMGYANVFSLANPNNCYALLVAFFTDNPAEFHRPDGSGYAFWKEQLLAVDRINPHVSARIARALDPWRRYSPDLARQMHAALLEVSADAGLSRAVREIIDRSLNMN